MLIKIYQILRSLSVRLFRLFCASGFRAFGRNVYVFPGVSIEGAHAISLGDDVVLQDGTHLGVHAGQPSAAARGISIGRASNIGRRNHIYALNQVTIGEKVLTAQNVYISDCTHEYADPDRPIIDQPIKALTPVTIGDGTWIGQGACIIGCRIGRNCVIGANSVVLKDVPDHSVVAGAPARLVRLYDPASQQWIRHDPNTTEPRR